MILIKRFHSKALIVSGLAIVAVRAALQTLIERSAYSSDRSDFALGVLFGVGIGLTLLGIWRNGRDDASRADTC